MKRLIILAAAILLVLTLALAQTQEKKSDKPAKVEQQNLILLPPKTHTSLPLRLTSMSLRMSR